MLVHLNTIEKIEMKKNDYDHIDLISISVILFFLPTLVIRVGAERVRGGDDKREEVVKTVEGRREEKEWRERDEYSRKREREDQEGVDES